MSKEHLIGILKTLNILIFSNSIALFLLISMRLYTLKQKKIIYLKTENSIKLVEDTENKVS